MLASLYPLPIGIDLCIGRYGANNSSGARFHVPRLLDDLLRGSAHISPAPFHQTKRVRVAINRIPAYTELLADGGQTGPIQKCPFDLSPLGVRTDRAMVLVTPRIHRRALFPDRLAAGLLTWTSPRPVDACFLAHRCGPFFFGNRERAFLEKFDTSSTQESVNLWQS